MSRHGFDGDKLSDDVARLTAADKVSPPAAQPSLMDAVRALAPLIETRTRLNWGDPKIAAVLSAAGYPIDAATLRSYRKRLRDESLLPPLNNNAPKQPIPAPAPIAPRPVSVTAPLRSEVGVLQSTPSITKPEVDGTMSHAPPKSAPTPTPTPTSGSTRSFSINPAKRPLDRA